MPGLFARFFSKPPPPPEFAPIAYLTAETNPYQCKRTWPPDFAQLSTKHQFRLERRYRRRSQLKWARPTWNKSVQLATWASIGFVVVYGVLFMQVDDNKTPFDGIRAWYNEQLGNTKSPNRPELSVNDNSPVSRKQPS